MLDPDWRDPVTGESQPIPPDYWRRLDRRTDGLAVLAVLAAAVAATAGVGALIYMRRRDWPRCAVCVALAAGCGYGAIRAWTA